MSHEKRLRSIDREAREATQKREAEKEFPTPPMTPHDKKVLHELDQDQHGPEFYAQIGPRKGARSHSSRLDAPEKEVPEKEDNAEQEGKAK